MMWGSYFFLRKKAKEQSFMSYQVISDCVERFDVFELIDSDKTLQIVIWCLIEIFILYMFKNIVNQFCFFHVDKHY